MKTMTSIDHSQKTEIPFKKSAVAQLAIYSGLFAVWFIIQLQK